MFCICVSAIIKVYKNNVEENNKKEKSMKLLEPIQVGKITLKNRIMFPPMTTGYEERDGC